jgi:hypothetical protein
MIVREFANDRSDATISAVLPDCADEPPTAWDFMSGAARGFAPPKNDPDTLLLWAGVSVYDQRLYARYRAVERPRLGRFIAEIHIPGDAPVRIERTGRSHGHYTVWGEPEILLGYVTDVRPAVEGR